MKITKKQIKKAFYKWQSDYEKNPSSFNNTKESVKSLAKEMTKTFIDYIKKVKK